MASRPNAKPKGKGKAKPKAKAKAKASSSTKGAQEALDEEAGQRNDEEALEEKPRRCERGPR
eukprot:4223794-Alexandrium_andersonii.AAC.1